MDYPTTCPDCKTMISLSDYFCPSCGKKIKEKPLFRAKQETRSSLSTTFLKQLSIYFLSFFLPPLGVWPAIKYLRQADEKSKKIGLAALFLTIISIVIASWLTTNLINSFNQELNNQFNLYQGLDF